MLQFSSARDDLRDPLASKQTNKKFLSFREDFTISTSLNKQNRTDDAINQNDDFSNVASNYQSAFLNMNTLDPPGHRCYPQ